MPRRFLCFSVFCSCCIHTTVMYISASCLLCTIVGVSTALPLTNNQNLSNENPELFSLHRSMLNINSTSGNETEMTQWLSEFIKGEGWTVELQDVVNPDLDPSIKRQNIYAYWGEQRDTKMIVNSHVDTVPPYYAPHEDEDTVYGRGANDAKGQIAAQFTAVNNLRKAGAIKEGEVALLYDVGEEEYGDGMGAANANLSISPQLIITGEPTESKQATGHRGSINFLVNSKGETAHSSVPDLGTNAIMQLFEFAKNKLLKYDLPSSDFWGKSVMSLNLIKGGLVPNQVPDSAQATVNVRNTVNASIIWDELIQNYNSTDNITLSLRDPSSGSAGSNPIKFDYIKNWRKTEVMPYGTDLGGWTHKDSLRFLLGPGSITSAHTDHEFIKKKELLEAVDYYTEFIGGMLNGTFEIVEAHTEPSES